MDRPIACNVLRASSIRTNNETGASDELVEPLAAGGEFRLVRIVSTGQASPTGFWYDQPEDEWVVVLSGAARLRFEGDDDELALGPGDSILIPAGKRHRVEWTHPNEPTVWLALHFRASR